MTLGMLFKEGRRRNLSPLWVKITGVLVLIFSAIELYGAPFGFIDSYILRGLFVSFAVALTFICFTPVKSEPKESENSWTGSGSMLYLRHIRKYSVPRFTRSPETRRGTG